MNGDLLASPVLVSVEKCENAKAVNVARRLATSQFTRCLRSAKTLRREAPRAEKRVDFFPKDDNLGL